MKIVCKFWIWILIFQIFSCTVSQKYKKFVGPYRISKHCKINGNDNVGTIICKDKAAGFQYGPISDSGPESMMEYVQKTFKAYYYESYFEKTYLDKKVRKIYRDSVMFVSAQVINPSIENECATCNLKVNTLFKKRPISYFLFLTEEQLSKLQNSDIKLDTINGLIFKYDHLNRKYCIRHKKGVKYDLLFELENEVDRDWLKDIIRN